MLWSASSSVLTNTCRRSPDCKRRPADIEDDKYANSSKRS
jgi:hypothetical protein